MEFVKLAYLFFSIHCLTYAANASQTFCHPFRRFGTDQMLPLTSITAYSRNVTGELQKGAIVRKPVKIYYRSLYAEAAKNVDTHNMLFTYSDIAHCLDSILNSWFNNYSISEPSFVLYFSSKSGAHSYLEFRFLALVQGLETLHRRKSKDTSMPEEEFDDLVKLLVDSCPLDKREWLESKMKYANEITLSRRVKQLVSPFKRFFGNSKSRSKFTREVVNTRNYLTHYSNELLSEFVSGDALYELCLKLESLLQLHLLDLIGLDDESIMRIVEKNKILKHNLKYYGS